MSKVFVVFLSLMLGGACSALKQVADYMAIGSIGAAATQFVHKVTGGAKDHIAAGGTDPLCCCSCLESSTFRCLDATDRKLSSLFYCCGYRKSNCGKCFDWLSEGLSIGTSIAACFIEFYADDTAQRWMSIACSGISILTSVGYFVGCFF